MSSEAFDEEKSMLPWAIALRRKTKMRDGVLDPQVVHVPFQLPLTRVSDGDHERCQELRDFKGSVV